MLEQKYQQLQERIRSLGSCLVAYSGGVDSTFLMYAAHQVLGDKAIAVVADTPSLPRRELEEALQIAQRFHWPVRIIHTQEFTKSEYLRNPANRCYFCKQELFRQMVALAKQEGFSAILYGENADDLHDHRPGTLAAREIHALAPLKEVGLTKQEIRTLSRRFGLPTAEKPEMACLSSRIPYGEPITVEKLRMIEQGEELLRRFGFRDVRVRHHQLSQGALARIEIAVSELPKFLDPQIRATIVKELKQLGYLYVTVDLEGYRRGSLNEGILKKKERNS